MSKIERRVSALEHQHQGRQGAGRLGIRTFQQDDTAPEIFREVRGAFYEDDRTYRRDEISALTAQGWQCIIVVYGDEQLAIING